ncbi:MAG: TRAP transporter substrate-binding protein DctP [Rhodospirillaceae bacterium]|jgi:TRAP-type C4-dicarboxylate transport system substrate-binding protein|nr:TRAP transporter substrate-binding protein DctP [Rhodospirillaceae bacterium]
MTKIANNIVASALICGVLTIAGTATAKTVKITVAAAPPPLVTFVGAFKNIVTKKIDARLASPEGKGFKIEWNHAYSGSLASFKEVFEAAEEGIAGAALILKNFEPSNLPLEAYPVHLPFVKMTRRQLLNIDRKLRKQIPEMNAAYTRHNQVHLESGPNDSMQLMTKFPVTKFEDLKGRKLGSSGTFAQWLRGTGAVSVNSSMNQSFTNIKNGVYEGYPISEILGFVYKTWAAAPHFTRVDFGPSLTAGVTFNADVWKSMPAHVQTIVREEVVKWPDYLEAIDAKKRGKFVGIMKKKGVKFSVLAESERKKWAMAMPNIAKEWAARLEKRGLPGNKLVATYVAEMRAMNVEITRDWDKN